MRWKRCKLCDHPCIPDYGKWKVAPDICIVCKPKTELAKLVSKTK